MKLKFKPLGLEAGKPIAFISDELAHSSGICEGCRIEALNDGVKLILPVNVVKKLLKADEISFSEEAVSFLKLRKGTIVHISLTLEPATTRIIMKKLNGKELTKKEIFDLVKDIVDNALNEAEIAYFVSAVYHNGMSFKETVYLTEAIAKTGTVIKWKNKIVADKHSTGGVPGNRVTPIVVSICACTGLTIPKTSSRAITTAAGTADVMETITNVNLSVAKLKSVVRKTNACLAWGGSLGLAPADDKLIRVEHLLNIDPEAQLLASIIAKKLSVGSKYVLIDIPCGSGAKVSLKEAEVLKRKFLKIGKYFKLKIKVVLTDGTQPIANGVGPMFEMQDVIRVLNRENPPKMLEEKSIFLAAELLEMTGKAKKGEGEKLARDILESKQALKKFNEIITAQGRQEYNFKPAAFQYTFTANRNCRIISINNKLINLLGRTLGCPTSKSSGIYLYKHKNETAKKGEKILTLYSDVRKKLKEGVRVLREEKPIKFD